MNNPILYFEVTDPFDVVYRNNSTSNILLPHTHNAVEIYFTLNDLPDVLLNDTVSAVKKGSLVIIPPYTVHQLFNKCLTMYERYIISINCEWLEYIFNRHPDVMHYAQRTSQPAIIALSEDNQTILAKAVDRFVKLDTVFNIKYYSEFFSLLETIDELISNTIGFPYTSVTCSQSVLGN